MSKQTALLLILFVAGSFSLIVATGPGFEPFPNLLAQVGITVGVPANPYNTLNDELSQEQAQLTQEQQDLAAREAADASSSAAATATPLGTWYIALGVAITAALVILNFYLDWRRSRRVESTRPPLPPTPPAPGA